MSIASDLAEGLLRDEWANRFVDTCVIKEETSSSRNDLTGQSEPVYTNRYSGSCLWRDEGQRGADLGEEQAQVRRGTLYVPHDTTGIKPGMLVDLASPRDDDLDGLQATVISVSADTYNTRKAIECEENQSD